MKRNTLFLLLALFLLFLPVFTKADTIYNIDFSSPAHTVGSQMTTGDSPPPRNTPTESIFGDQIVRNSFGSLTQQPVELIPEDSGFLRYSQFKLDLEFTEHYPVYRLDFDVYMENFMAGAYDNFVVLFDTPSVVRLDLNSYGNILENGYLTYGDIIGSFDFGQTVSMSVTVNMENNLWSIYSNSNHLWTGQFFHTSQAYPEPPDIIESIRFSLRDDSDFTNIPGCAVDNIRVIGAPEPATVLLLGLGAAFLKKT
ncbi:MAG: PEP-CTERM sorting domain-containing protein [Phycisphaerae bacterium]|nr:PEP-CTERM sorting domain-containing protein [Phycisphaerae bacterium]MDD5381655.1 PEP-CTERM sorting domain-containing protein [Phycisphaerae bacterium]